MVYFKIVTPEISDQPDVEITMPNCKFIEKTIDKALNLMIRRALVRRTPEPKWKGGDTLGSVVKKRRKKMRKHKHRKLLARTRHQRRKGR
jgi:hypothetical protein